MLTPVPIVLSQVFPAAAVETLLFQVPATSRTYFQGITVCNQVGGNDSFRISVSLVGAATTSKDYIYYDTPIKGNDTFLVELDFTMNVNDVIRVYSTNGTCSFILYGNLT